LSSKSFCSLSESSVSRTAQSSLDRASPDSLANLFGKFAEVSKSTISDIVTPGFNGGESGCFMNSMMQVIAGKPLLFIVLLTHPKQNEQIRKCARRFANNEDIDISMCIRYLKTGQKTYLFPQWAKGTHEDAGAVYTTLLTPIEGKLGEHCQEEYNAENPLMVQMIETITLNGETTKKTRYWNNYIQLYLSDGETVEKMLEAYLVSNAENVQEVKKFAKPPECLAFGFGGMVKKTEKHLQAPQSLQWKDINDPFIDLDSRHVIEGKGGRYAVHSIIIYKGGGFFGHYYTYSRKKGEWYCYNDEKRNKVNESEDLKNTFINDIQHFVHFIFAVRTEVR